MMGKFIEEDLTFAEGMEIGDRGTLILNFPYRMAAGDVFEAVVPGVTNLSVSCLVERSRASPGGSCSVTYRIERIVRRSERGTHDRGN
jgi:hypothetical protein